MYERTCYNNDRTQMTVLPGTATPCRLKPCLGQAEEVPKSRFVIFCQESRSHKISGQSEISRRAVLVSHTTAGTGHT